MPDSNVWMRTEIAQWLREGVISDEQAERLLARYPHTPAVIPGDDQWGRTLFAVIGVVLIGLGVILVFAYNWAAMPRHSKLGVIFGAILVAHSLGWLLGRRPAVARIAESLHLLGTMLFGAGIWLVAQIYHIDAHYPDGFWLWGMGALAMAWALPSAVHGLLATVLLLAWTAMEAAEFAHPVMWGGVLLAATIAPLAYRLRSAALLGLAALLLPAIVGLDVWRVDERGLYLNVALLAAGYLFIAPWLQQSAWPHAGDIAYRSGLLYWLPVLFIGTFVSDLDRLQLRGGIIDIYTALLGVLCATALALRLARASSRPTGWQGWTELAVVAVPLAVVVVNVLVVDTAILLPVVCNLAILVLSLAMIYSGTEGVQGRRVIVGCTVLAALAVARFGDLFTSLLSRAGIFLLLGTVLFVVGLRFSRQQTRRKLEKPHA